MPFVPVPQAAQVVLRFTAGTSKCENVLCYRGFSDMDTEDAVALGEAIEGIIGASGSPWRAAMSNAVVLDEIQVRPLHDETAPTSVIPAGVPGSLTSALMPNNVTIAVRLGTAFGGRSFRGRIFWIGLTEAQCNGDELASAASDAVIAAVNSILEPLGDTGPALAVRSQFTAGAPRETGLATVVTSVSTDRILDSQRRRLLGRGR